MKDRFRISDFGFPGSRRRLRIGGAFPEIRHPTSEILLLCIALASCGYHVSGKADLLPKRIRTIAIPAFGNATTKIKLSERLTSAVTREFISRTRYRIVADPNQAEALLTGSVINFFSYPTIFDPATARASSVQAVVILQIALTDRSNNAVLFARPSLEVRERYE